MELADEDQECKKSDFNIYKYDAQLALAFQVDCESLLEKYSNRGDFTFGAFAEVWKETCFVSVFESQDYVLMLQNFLENCFFIAKKFLFSTNIYIQTGALYLMYSLYFKQPIKDFVKIRLLQTEVDKLNEITARHASTKFLQPRYIFKKMHLRAAFEYSALVLPLGLDAKFMRRYDLSSTEIYGNDAEQCPLEKFKDLVEKDAILQEFQDTDKEYQKLIGEYKARCQSLVTFPSKITEDLEMALKRVFESESEGQESDSKLNRVKKKAMKNKNAVYRADKQVVTEMDLDYRPSCSKNLV